MSVHFPGESAPSLSSEDALQRLVAGNRRSVSGACAHPHLGSARREAVLAGQHPFAIVLCCSDSRVPPELIFDQGIGDLFVVRNAGNVLDEVVEGSIGYALEHLHAPLVVVLGHTRCGAVTAAIQSADAPGRLGAILRILQGAVISARVQPGDAVMNTAAANVRLNVEQLRAEIKDLPLEGQVRVVGGLYHLETGQVEFFDE